MTNCLRSWHRCCRRICGDPDNGGRRDRKLRQGESEDHATNERVDAALEKMAGGTDSHVRGGMTTKIQAAKIASAPAFPVIASGRSITAGPVIAGEAEGTIFVPQPNKLRGRKRWIAFFHHPRAPCS